MKNSHSLGEHRVDQGLHGQSCQCDRWLQSVRTLASITAQQQRWLKLFQVGGRVKNVELPSWISFIEVVQTKFQVLPASSSNDRKWRKTLDVNRRLFTR